MTKDKFRAVSYYPVEIKAGDVVTVFKGKSLYDDIVYLAVNGRVRMTLQKV